MAYRYKPKDDKGNYKLAYHKETPINYVEIPEVTEENVYSRVATLEHKILDMETRAKTNIDAYVALKQIQLEGSGTGANRTRIIPITLFRSTAPEDVTPSSDTHGSIVGVPHIHLSDGINLTLTNLSNIHWPNDYVPSEIKPVLNMLFLSTATGNARLVVTVKQVKDGDTSNDTLLSDTAVHAVSATNTLDTITWAFDETPERDSSISLTINRNATHVDDTIVGNLGIYEVWIEYTAFI